MSKLYTKEHEWIELIDGVYYIGLSLYAVKELGEINFVELPEVGDTFEKGEAFAVVESLKAASDIYMPIKAKIKAINKELVDAPENLAENAETSAWLCQIEDVDNSLFKELMNFEQYKNFINE